MAGPISQDLVIRGRQNMGEATRGLGRLQSTIVTLNQAWELTQKVVGAVGKAIASTAGEALAQDRSLNRLIRTLGQMGADTDAARERVADFTAEMQRTTRFGDDVMEGVLNRMAQATRALEPSMNDLFDFARTAADVSEATGRDIAATSELVARAAAGDVRTIQQLLPAYRDQLREIGRIEDAAERGAAALELLGENFGGAAEAINPFELALTRIQNGMGDMREAFGNFVIQNDEVADAFSHVADTVDRLVAVFSEGGPAADAMGSAIASMANTAADTLISLAEAVIQAFQQVQVAASAVQFNSASQTLANLRESGALAETGVGEDIEVRDVGRARRALFGQGDVRRRTAQREDVLAEIERLENIRDGAATNLQAELQALADIRAGAFDSQGPLGGEPEDPDAGLADGMGGGGGASGRRSSGGGGGPTLAELVDDGTIEEAQALIAAFAEGPMAELALASEELSTKLSDDLSASLLELKENAEASAGGILRAKDEIELMSRPLDEATRALLEQAEAANQAKLAWGELGDTLQAQVTPSMIGFGQSSAAAFGTAAATGASFADTAAQSALKGAGSIASTYGEVFAAQGAGFLLIPGMHGQGIGLIAAGLTLTGIGAGLGASAGNVGGRGRGGRSRGGQGVPTGLAGNLRDEQRQSTAREERVFVFLDGEQIAASNMRQSDLGGQKGL